MKTEFRPTLFAFVSLLSSSHAMAACESAAGTWTDNFLYQWNIAQNSQGQISGNVRVDSYCSSTQWPVTGTFLGDGQFSVTATNPTPDQNCAASWFDYYGSINKPGCHAGNGSWFNSAWVSGPWALGKPCDVPSGESSSAVDWTAEGTTMLWRVTLSPSSINFGGRTVTENVQTTDNCYFTGSQIPNQTGESGNPADINVQNYYHDTVGWTPFAVNYYRGASRAPCAFSSTQQMRIDCATGVVSYIVNGLSGTIGVTTVASSRQGQPAVRTWP